MARRGNIGAILNLIFCLIQYYWVWEMCPIWVKTPLQCIALYYIVIWYFYIVTSFYKDSINGDLSEYDDSLLLLTWLAIIGVPILFYFVYINTLNKIYLTIQHAINGYYSYFVDGTYID